MKKLTPFLLLIILLQSCLMDRIENRNIKVINDSSQPIYCLKSQDDLFKYPYFDYNYKSITEVFKIQPGSAGYVLDNPTSWDSYIKESKNGKLRLFIITQESLDKFGWGEILDKNIYDKVYSMSIDDLKKAHWKVIYDGLPK
jgi:hypothetical protein